MADGYNDEPTAEELAILAADEQNPIVPPAADDDSNPITPEQVASEQGVNTDGTPKTSAPPAPAAPAPADPNAVVAPVAAQTDDQRFAAFLEQHKGKTPDQILQLAYQQTSRANQAGFQARQTKEQLDGLHQRATAAIERVAKGRAAIEAERQSFGQQLQDDPDAATRAVHDRLMTAEEQALAREEMQARRDVAVSMASTAIPGFDIAATQAFGAEMNYTPEELEGVTDPRDIVTLHFASLTGRLVKAGVMDVNGNILQMPGAVAATDVRLTAPAPVTTLSSVPARGNSGGQTLEQQLADITNMTDAQMEELERTNPGLIDSLLKKAG
jgi:hypothetical protein